MAQNLGADVSIWKETGLTILEDQIYKEKPKEIVKSYDYGWSGVNIYLKDLNLHPLVLDRHGEFKPAGKILYATPRADGWPTANQFDNKKYSGKDLLTHLRSGSPSLEYYILTEEFYFKPFRFYPVSGDKYNEVGTVGTSTGNIASIDGVNYAEVVITNNASMAYVKEVFSDVFKANELFKIYRDNFFGVKTIQNFSFLNDPNVIIAVKDQDGNVSYIMVSYDKTLDYFTFYDVHGVRYVNSVTKKTQIFPVLNYPTKVWIQESNIDKRKTEDVPDIDPKPKPETNQGSVEEEGEPKQAGGFILPLIIGAGVLTMFLKRKKK